MATDLRKLWEQWPENERRIVNVLNQIQQTEGYISRSMLVELAELAKVPESQLHGLVSFFSSLRSRPVGAHHLCVCFGTACYARGAPLIYDRLRNDLQLKGDDDTSADGLVTVEQVYCVGACSRAPVVVADGKIKGEIKSCQVPFLLQELRGKS